MAQPRKPRADEDPAGIYWHDDPEKLERLYAYCRNDVEVERELFRRLPPLADSEQALWVLDALINQRGFHTDGALLEAASRIAATAGQAAHDELARITDGALTSTDQVTALQTWLGEHGCEVKDVRKPTLKHALTRKALDPAVRRVIELRLGAAHAAAAKIDTLLAWRNADGRVRGTLRFTAPVRDAGPDTDRSLKISNAMARTSTPSVKRLRPAIWRMFRNFIRSHLRSSAILPAP